MKAVAEKQELKVTIEVNESELILLHALIGVTRPNAVNRIFTAIGVPSPDPHQMFKALNAIVKENNLQPVYQYFDVVELEVGKHANI